MKSAGKRRTNDETRHRRVASDSERWGVGDERNAARPPDGLGMARSRPMPIDGLAYRELRAGRGNACEPAGDPSDASGRAFAVGVGGGNL